MFTKKISDYLSNPSNEDFARYIDAYDEYISDMTELTDQDVKFLASEINGEFMESEGINDGNYMDVLHRAIYQLGIRDNTDTKYL